MTGLLHCAIPRLVEVGVKPSVIESKFVDSTYCKDPWRNLVDRHTRTRIAMAVLAPKVESVFDI